MQRNADYMVKKIMDMLVVGASEAPIPAVDAQNIVDYMNDYMASIDVMGIDIGYTEVTSLASPITVPSGAIRGIIANTAMLVAPSYAVPITQALAMQAKAGQAAMVRLASGIGPTRYPSTLPRGSGNSCNNGSINNRFYPDLQGTILAEPSGSIGLEENTASETPWAITAKSRRL